MADHVNVLDTGYVLSGRHAMPPPNARLPRAVLDEIQPGGPSHRRLQAWLAAGLAVHQAGPEAVAAVTAEAQREGDAPRLSSTDLAVIALAHEQKGVLWTDDKTMQNVAHRLGLQTQGIEREATTQAYRFAPRCTGCRRWTDPHETTCAICGAPIRQARRRD